MVIISIVIITYVQTTPPHTFFVSFSALPERSVLPAGGESPQERHPRLGTEESVRTVVPPPHGRLVITIITVIIIIIIEDASRHRQHQGSWPMRLQEGAREPAGTGTLESTCTCPHAFLDWFPCCFQVVFDCFVVLFF